jgi:hypothetical protein
MCCKKFIWHAVLTIFFHSRLHVYTGIIDPEVNEKGYYSKLLSASYKVMEGELVLVIAAQRPLLLMVNGFLCCFVPTVL